MPGVKCLSYPTHANTTKREHGARRLKLLMRKEALYRGRLREDKANKACELLKQQERIRHHYPACSRHDNKDKGIDHFIITWEGERKELQIKGSVAGLIKHRKEFPGVPVIMILGTESDEEVAEAIAKELFLPASSPFVCC